MLLENLMNKAPLLVIKQFRRLMPLLMMMMVRRNNYLYGATTEWGDVWKLIAPRGHIPDVQCLTTLAIFCFPRTVFLPDATPVSH